MYFLIKIDYKLVLLILTFLIMGVMVNTVINDGINVSERSDSTVNKILHINNISIEGPEIEIGESLENKEKNFSSLRTTSKP